MRTERSGHALQRAAQRLDHLADLAFLDDQRRRQRDDVAGDADQESLLEAVDEDVIGAGAGGTLARGEFDAGDETAKGLGVRVEWVRTSGMMLASVLTAIIILSMVMTPMGKQRTKLMGRMDSLHSTSTSRGSPSSAQVRGMKP